MKHQLVFIILSTFMLMNVFYQSTNAAKDIEIIGVYWSDSGKEWAAMPGDVATLIVEFRSLIEETICGIKAVLWPIDSYRPFPFSSIRGQYIEAYTDKQMKFGDKAQLTFNIKIDDDAEPGIYEAHLYFFYYDCDNPEYPQMTTTRNVNIKVWPPPHFRIINISWLSNEGFQTSAGPGDSNKILSITFVVPKYYEVSNIAATLYLGEYFSNLTGGDLVKTSYTGQISENQYFTLRFPLSIRPDAPLGTHNLSLVLSYYDKWLTLQAQEILIPVTIAGSSQLDISIQSSVFTAGSTSNIDIKVMNTGSSPVYSVRVSLSSDALVLFDSEVRIAEVKPNTELSYAFLVHTPGALSEGFYPITIQAQYVDSSGIMQTLLKTVKVEVRSPPLLSLSIYIKNPEVIVGGSHDLSIVIENPYNSPITDINIKASFENLPLALTGGGRFYFQGIPAKSSIELRIPVKISPSASTGISYGKLSINYRNPNGELKTDEVSIPIIIKPDLKFEFGEVTLSSTSVVAGESIDISGDVYNRGLSTGKLCEVKVKSSPPLMETSDSTYYIGDISSLSKASFSVSIDVASNAKPGKYTANLVISCSDVFGGLTEYSKIFEVEVTQRAVSMFTTPTVQRQATTQAGLRQFSILQNPIIISLIIAIVAVIVVVFLLRRRKKHEAS